MSTSLWIWMLVLGTVIAILSAGFTLLWWKVGDQWADEEYRRFGHGGGGPRGEAPTVVKNFESNSGSADSNDSGREPS